MSTARKVAPRLWFDAAETLFCPTMVAVGSELMNECSTLPTRDHVREYLRIEMLRVGVVEDGKPVNRTWPIAALILLGHIESNHPVRAFLTSFPARSEAPRSIAGTWLCSWYLVFPDGAHVRLADYGTSELGSMIDDELAGNWVPPTDPHTLTDWLAAPERMRAMADWLAAPERTVEECRQVVLRLGDAVILHYGVFMLIGNGGGAGLHRIRKDIQDFWGQLQVLTTFKSTLSHPVRRAGDEDYNEGAEALIRDRAAVLYQPLLRGTVM